MKKLTVIVMLIGAVSSFSTGSGEIFREIGQEQQMQTYYDVPLEKELQDHIREVCTGNGIDMTMVLAVMEKESGYNADAVGDGEKSFGLMQIQPRWHKGRMDRLGVTDLFDPYQNIIVGADILKELSSKEKGDDWTIMAYNGGEQMADEHAENGTTTSYADGVNAIRERIRNSAYED